jgi:hypothetical protein
MARSGSRGLGLLILDLGAITGWVVSTTPRPLYPREIPGTHCTGGWVGPMPLWTRAKYLAPTGKFLLFQIHSLLTVHSFYTVSTSLYSGHIPTLGCNPQDPNLKNRSFWLWVLFPGSQSLTSALVAWDKLRYLHQSASVAYVLSSVVQYTEIVITGPSSSLPFAIPTELRGPQGFKTYHIEFIGTTGMCKILLKWSSCGLTTCGSSTWCLIFRTMKKGVQSIR